MGCGENKLMAQQVQETVHKIGEEGWEPSWLGAAVMQYHYLQKDNIGIDSKKIPAWNMRNCLLQYV